MIPPNLPISAVPVTSQLDPVRHTPTIPPVAAVQASPGEPALEFEERDQDESALRLHEEFQRNHRQQRERGGQSEEDEEQSELLADAYLPIPGYELNPDDTVPVAPLIDNEPRQGLLVDIQI